MFNYIKAELYRVTHKRSLYIYYGILITAFLGITLISSISDAIGLLELGTILPPFIGMFVFIYGFITVYADDLSSKTLGSSLSTGVSRSSLILSKIIVFCVYLISVFAVLLAIFFGLYLVYGGSFTSLEIEIIKAMLQLGVVSILSNLAFIGISSLIVYGLQSSNGSIFAFVLLSLGFVTNILDLISLALPIIKDALQFTVTSVMTSAMQAISSRAAIPDQFWIVTSIYIVGTVALSIVLFKRREIVVS